jgi:hypothetical protein
LAPSRERPIAANQLIAKDILGGARTGQGIEWDDGRRETPMAVTNEEIPDGAQNEPATVARGF